MQNGTKARQFHEFETFIFPKAVQKHR